MSANVALFVRYARFRDWFAGVGRYMMGFRDERFDRRHWLAVVGCIGALAWLLTATREPSWLRAGVVIGVAIVLWATAILPQWLTALVFFALCAVGGVAPPGTIFSGLTSQATWLVFAGLVMGAASRHTGLARHLAQRVTQRLTGSYNIALAGAILLGLILAFFIPSGMSRIVLLVPILVTLADELGYAAPCRGRSGLVLAGMFGTFLPGATILPAGVPNNVLMGAADSVLGSPLSYSGYLVLNFPVLGLLKTVLFFGVIRCLYPDGAPQPATGGRAANDVLSRPERFLALVLAVGVLLWMTDSLHGISPAWVGLLVAIVCLWPGSGLMPDRPLSRISLAPLLYVAGIVSLGALANESGLAARVAHGVVDVLPLTHSGGAAIFGMLSGLSTVLAMVITGPGVPAVLTPLAPQLAHAAGWTPRAIVMTQVVGFSTPLLPYMAPPLVVGAFTADIALREVTRLCVIMAVISIVVLWPLDYIWWHMLGVI